MWYVCEVLYAVLYAVLYVRVSCFVVSGCAISWRYIHVCNSYVFSVVNMFLDMHLLNWHSPTNTPYPKEKSNVIHVKII